MSDADEAPHVAGCTGKTRDRTMRVAQRVARFIRREDDQAYVHAFHCRACHGFHVGGNRAHERRGQRKRP
jgi:hypothetical protein